LAQQAWLGRPVFERVHAGTLEARVLARLMASNGLAMAAAGKKGGASGLTAQK
jgi:hypothetical protein